MTCTCKTDVFIHMHFLGIILDQWSPVNPDGKRQYDRRFLLELQNNPLSLKKPESLPNLEVVRDGPGRVSWKVCLGMYDRVCL